MRGSHTSSRAVRIKAAELAAQCMSGVTPEKGYGGQMMSLLVLFETYIIKGCDATENEMKLLSHKVRGAKRNLRVVAGGKL